MHIQNSFCNSRFTCTRSTGNDAHRVLETAYHGLFLLFSEGDVVVLLILLQCPVDALRGDGLMTPHEPFDVAADAVFLLKAAGGVEHGSGHANVPALASTVDGLFTDLLSDAFASNIFIGYPCHQGRQFRHGDTHMTGGSRQVQSVSQCLP